MSSNAESIPGVPTKASERWKRATHVTSTYVGICKQFRTLRDMRDDLIIDPQELQFVKKIGEGINIIAVIVFDRYVEGLLRRLG